MMKALFLQRSSYVFPNRARGKEYLSNLEKSYTLLSEIQKRKWEGVFSRLKEKKAGKRLFSLNAAKKCPGKHGAALSEKTDETRQRFLLSSFPTVYIKKKIQRSVLDRLKRAVEILI